MNRRNFLLSLIFASVLGSGLTILGSRYLFKSEEKVRVEFNDIEEEQKANLVGQSDIDGTIPVELNFREAASKTRDAVVHIKTFKTITEVARDPFQDPFFRDFFDDHMRRPKPKKNEGPQPFATGSGVILTPAGFIATNNHVVKGAEKVEVTLSDKRKYEAEIVGTDPTTDLALLKISEKNLPFIPYANSDNVEVGDWVLAVGNPFNLNSTVTAGIVSAKGRNINILHDRENLAIESFIQTDAAVNPGNSGGALVNPQGKLVGINTAIASPSGTYAGYSFAVPSNLVKKVIQDLRDYGQVQRALLGVSIREITADLMEEKELKDLNGVYVSEVRDNSAAGEAGLEVGDVIIQVETKKVNSPSELQEAVALHRPGDKVLVKFYREGEVQEAEVVLRNKMGTTEVVNKGDKMTVNTLGAQLRTVNESEREKYGIRNGATVVAIANGKLRDAGLRKGHIIVRINYIDVVSPDDVLRLLKFKDDGALIEALDVNGKKQYLGFGW